MDLLLTLWVVFSTLWGLAYGVCNQKHMVQPNEVAYITSPGYPGNFTQYVDCYYELYSSSEHPGLLVYVDVVDVTLSCDDDSTHLHVYDGFSRSPRFLGRICEGGQRTFESPKQTLYITFRSRTEHAGRSRGFRLRVRTVPKYCHCFTQETAVLDVASSPALLSSPYYPYGTEPNVNCRWLLKAPENKRVNVTLLHTDMKGSSDCHNFGLHVYDGKTSYDDKLLASVCRNSVQTLQSSGPYLLVVFTSGPLVFRSGGGVKLQYSAISFDGGDKHVISQTLFYVITFLLIFLIFVILFVAIIKLFVLPKCQKQSERRRRAARVRLTHVSQNGSSQSDSSSSTAAAATQSESGHHASCSRASSSMSGSSVGSHMSGMSLTRLLSLYGLKKCRQEHRCSAHRSGHSPDCVYSAQRSGVVLHMPGYETAAHMMPLPGDLPPSYEEALGHEVITQEVRGHREVTELQPARRDVEGQETTTWAGSDVADQGQGRGQEVGCSSRQPGMRETLGDVVEQAVMSQVLRQTARDHATRLRSTQLHSQQTTTAADEPEAPAADEPSEPSSTVGGTETEQTSRVGRHHPSGRCSQEEQVTVSVDTPLQTLDPGSSEESVGGGRPGEQDEMTEDGPPSTVDRNVRQTAAAAAVTAAAEHTGTTAAKTSAATAPTNSSRNISSSNSGINSSRNISSSSNNSANNSSS